MSFFSLQNINYKYISFFNFYPNYVVASFKYFHFLLYKYIIKVYIWFILVLPVNINKYIFYLYMLYYGFIFLSFLGYFYVFDFMIFLSVINFIIMYCFTEFFLIYNSFEIESWNYDTLLISGGTGNDPNSDGTPHTGDNPSPGGSPNPGGNPSPGGSPNPGGNSNSDPKGPDSKGSYPNKDEGENVRYEGDNIRSEGEKMADLKKDDDNFNGPSRPLPNNWWHLKSYRILDCIFNSNWWRSKSYPIFNSINNVIDNNVEDNSTEGHKTVNKNDTESKDFNNIRETVKITINDCDNAQVNIFPPKNSKDINLETNIAHSTNTSVNIYPPCESKEGIVLTQLSISQLVINQPRSSESILSQPVVSKATINQTAVNQGTVNSETVRQPTVNQPTVSSETVSEPTVNQPTVNSETVSEPTVSRDNFPRDNSSRVKDYEPIPVYTTFVEEAARSPHPVVTQTITMFNSRISSHNISSGDSISITEM
jgi:hypothetical protein